MTHQNKEGLEAAIARLDELAGMKSIPSVLTRAGREFIAEKVIAAYAQKTGETDHSPDAGNMVDPLVSSLREENESLRNAFEMSAQESSEVIIALQQENERLRKERDGLQSALHGVRDNRDGLLREADAQLKIYRELLEAFVNVRDQFPESAKLIDTRSQDPSNAS